MICYHCGKEFKPRKQTRKACPKCSHPMWKPPTLSERFKSGVSGFVQGFKMEQKYKERKIAVGLSNGIGLSVYQNQLKYEVKDDNNNS